jgi:hypothetical protein
LYGREQDSVKLAKKLLDRYPEIRQQMTGIQSFAGDHRAGRFSGFGDD